jgi:hypothetical protein
VSGLGFNKRVGGAVGFVLAGPSFKTRVHVECTRITRSTQGAAGAAGRNKKKATQVRTIF